MIPISDSPNPKGISWVNLLLIVLNVGVYVLLLPQMGTVADPNDPRLGEYLEVLQAEGRVSDAQVESLRAQVSEYDLTVFEYGSRPVQWSWLTMLTSMFLHGGFMHLAGNMLFLWIYGNNVEHRMGRVGYLVVYLLTGVAASFGDIALRPDSGIPGVGASGAISGVLGMYFLWFGKNRVRLLVPIPPAFPRFELGARWVLGFYIVAQNILPAIAEYGSGGSGVAHGAHIGGFLAGMVMAFVFGKLIKQWPGAAVGPVPDDPRALLETYRRVLRGRPDKDHAIEAHLGAARVLAGPLGQPAMAYQHLVRAVDAGASAAQLQESREVLEAIRGQVATIPKAYA